MEIFVPRSAQGSKVRVIGVAAHKDDLELFAAHGILRSYGQGGFAGVVLTDGGACPRGRGYEGVSDEDMAQLRTAEQKRAAETGRYEILYLMEKTSDEVKRNLRDTAEELAALFRRHPATDALYLHSPFDRHATHVAAFKCAVAALNMLKDEEKPRKVYACEVWRSLDWLAEEDRTALDVSGGERLTAEQLSAYASQNAAKRYDIAALARRAANATFAHGHSADTSSSVIFAADATECAYGKSAEEFVKEKIANFSREVTNMLESLQ